MKTLYRSLLAATLIVSLPIQAQDEVRVFNWSDYIDDSILADFEAQTGIRVIYDVYDSNDTLETRLLAGGSGYDVVVPTGSYLARQIQAGVYRELDKSRLPNLEHMWDEIVERTERYDSGNRYSVNYMWGTTGFGYNVDAVAQRMPDAPVTSWRMLFDPEVVANFADCGVYILDEPSDVVPAALNYIGEDPASHDPEVIRKAEDVLMAIRPHVEKFHSSEYINALANGDICLAMGWSGDVLQARDRAEEAGSGVVIDYVIPDEGALMWSDQMAIPADAPHPDNAHAFINFIMEPEVIARASNYVFYANGNLSSKEYLDPEVLEDPAIYPPDATMERLYTTLPYPPRVQREVTRLWTRVKTGR